MLTIGAKAPFFSLQGLLEGKEGSYSLKDFLGKWVILYFYPKDDTPGCTQEACDFRDSMTALSEKNAVVLGVSKDPIISHTKFIQKFGLPFALLSDPDTKVCEQYGAWKEKSMYGKTFLGISRTTVLIDPSGNISKIWEKVKVSGHIQEVIDSIPV